MKNLGILLGALTTLSMATPAMAAVKKACYAKAEAAVEKHAEPGYYDEDGFNAFACEVATNKKAVICDVGAMKGNGEAADTFRVVLSDDCKRTYRVELTGEE